MPFRFTALESVDWRATRAIRERWKTFDLGLASQVTACMKSDFNSFVNSRTCILSPVE